MIDAIDTITEAIPCNIVYGRRQAAEGIARALSIAGFTIMSKKDVEAVRDEALEEYKAVLDKVNHATDREIEAAAIRARKETGE